MTISNLLQRVVSWLQLRPIINLLLVFAYFLFILFLHGSLVKVSIAIEKTLSLDVYNAVIAVIFLSVVSFFVFIVQKKLREESEDRTLKLTYLFITITAILIHSRFMFDSNIEIIHSFEYSFLVFLVFPFTKRFGAAIFFTLPFMLFDEWYQYTILYPSLDYFDLNDIMMDTYGCGLVMIVLMCLGLKGTESVKEFWKRPEFVSLLALIVCVLLAVKLCFIADYGNNICNNTLLVMNKRTTAEPFLRLHAGHNIMYHVMKPLEALICISALHLFYLGIDSLRKHST